MDKAILHFNAHVQINILFVPRYSNILIILIEQRTVFDTMSECYKFMCKKKSTKFVSFIIPIILLVLF